MTSPWGEEGPAEGCSVLRSWELMTAFIATAQHCAAETHTGQQEKFLYHFLG